LLISLLLGEFGISVCTCWL